MQFRARVMSFALASLAFGAAGAIFQGITHFANPALEGITTSMPGSRTGER